MASQQPLARSTDPVTSHEAAASTNVVGGRAVVLDVLRRHGPMSDEEIMDRIHADYFSRHPISQSGARTRRAELVRAGLVEDSGQTTLTRSGRRTIVWQEAQR